MMYKPVRKSETRNWMGTGSMIVTWNKQKQTLHVHMKTSSNPGTLEGFVGRILYVSFAYWVIRDTESIKEYGGSANLLAEVDESRHFILMHKKPIDCTIARQGGKYIIGVQHRPLQSRFPYAQRLRERCLYDFETVSTKNWWIIRGRNNEFQNWEHALSSDSVYRI